MSILRNTIKQIFSGHTGILFRPELAQLQLHPGHLPDWGAPPQHGHVRPRHSEGSRVLAN